MFGPNTIGLGDDPSLTVDSSSSTPLMVGVLLLGFLFVRTLLSGTRSVGRRISKRRARSQRKAELKAELAKL